jgi:hypothetical protein
MDDEAATTARADGNADSTSGAGATVTPDAGSAPAEPAEQATVPASGRTSSIGAAGGEDAGPHAPGAVSASGIGPVGSWLIGAAVAVVIGAAALVVVTRRRARLR